MKMLHNKCYPSYFLLNSFSSFIFSSGRVSYDIEAFIIQEFTRVYHPAIHERKRKWLRLPCPLRTRRHCRGKRLCVGRGLLLGLGVARNCRSAAIAIDKSNQARVRACFSCKFANLAKIQILNPVPLAPTAASAACCARRGALSKAF